jgi:hypothetical protein
MELKQKSLSLNYGMGNGVEKEGRHINNFEKRNY